MGKFKIGQKAVYPAQGVGEIEGIEKKEISGHKQSFYILRILDNDIRIMIPVDKAEVVGLRNIIDAKEANKVFNILKKRPKNVDSKTWNRRYRDYMCRIKTGSLFEVAAVVRDLYHRSQDKELSFGERKMLDTARTLLVTEMCFATSRETKSIEKRIEKLLERKPK